MEERPVLVLEVLLLDQETLVECQEEHLVGVQGQDLINQELGIRFLSPENR